MRPAVYRRSILGPDNLRLSILNLRAIGVTLASSQLLILAVITLIAASLRFYKLGELSFWIDEVFTVNATSYLADWPLARLPIHLVLIHGALAIFGVSEWSARLAPALIGILSIVVLYFPIRRLFGPRTALIAALLIAISPWHLFWSQNARFYTLLLLFYSLGLFLFFLGVEHGHRGYLLVSILFLGLSIREKESSFYFVFVIFSYFVFLRLMRFDLPLGLTPKRLSLLFLPAIAYGLYDVYRIQVEHLPSMITEFFQDFGYPNHSPLRLLFAIIYRIDLVLVCLGVFGGMYMIAKRSRAGLFVSLGAVVPVIILLVLANFMFTHDRYVFVAFPFWAVLGAVAISSLFDHTEGLGRLLALGIAVLVIANYLGNDVLYFEYQNGARSDWKGAFEIVREREHEGDIIYSTRPVMGAYYLDPKVRHINQLDPEAARAAKDRSWFVIDEESQTVKPALYQWVRENAALIEVREVYIPGKSLNIRIYLYDPALTP